MLRRTTIVVFVSSLVLASVGVASATSMYTFTAMYPAGSDTQAYPMAMSLVNGVPLTAGVTGGGNANFNQGYPCIWNSAGVGTDVISYIPGSPTRGKAWAMDTSGDIVGNEKVSTGQSAYFLASGSTLGVTLPILQGASNAWVVPYGMENPSTVVGVDGPTNGSGQAVMWTKTGWSWSAAALPNLAGGNYSQANAISSSGIVGGWSNYYLNTLQYQEPVTWTYSGSSWAATDLTTRVPTGSNPQNATGEATVLAVNSGGVAVGNDNLSNFPSTSWYACVFQGGNAVTLGSFPNTQSEMDSATGINDSGVVVGYSAYGTNGNHAFIWDSVNGFRDMNTVFGPTGYNVIPTGWTLESAASIDNNGDIAGEAITSGGEYLGFVITAPVPEPLTLLLAAAALVGLLTYACRKRRQP